METSFENSASVMPDAELSSTIIDLKNETGDDREIMVSSSDAKSDLKNESLPDVQLNTAQEENEQGVLDMVDITPEKSGGVTKQVMQPGEGDEFPQFGDRVRVHYKGWLLNKENTEFDSNVKEDPCEFNLGQGTVIKGWDLGIATMKKGEVALFIVQPQYAYGDLGNPPAIPPHTPLLFEVKLYDWRLDDLSPKKDGSILRKIIVKGEGTICPNEGSLVKVKLVGYYEDAVFEDCEKEFILGEGCCVKVLEGIELALPKFHLKERSLIYLKSKYGFDKGEEEYDIPPDAAVMYEVTLLSFEKAKDVWEMNSDEKLERAQISKEKGVSFLKEGKFKVALKQFRWILLCLEKEPGVSPESQESRNSLLFSAYLNITLCLLKLTNYVEAIKFCDKALEMEPGNEKALFRKGQARIHINDYKEALQDFETLCSLYPDNKAAKQYTVICQDAIKKQNLKDKSTYDKMFEKFVKQDEERLRSMKTETGVWEDEKGDEKEDDSYMNETQRLIERSNSVLRDANIIELSNTAF